MAKLVVDGAVLTCSMGNSPAKLSVLPTNQTYRGPAPAATVQDMKPAVNLAPFGNTSPEGTHRHNLILSQLRAAAVRQAILDAIVVDPEFIVADGDGDELAKRTPVDPKLDPRDPKNKDAKKFDEADPDGDTKKRDIFKTAHTEQSDQWPKFRKVVIYWWGQFFAKVETTGSQSDQDADQPSPTDPTQPQEAPPGQSDTTPVA